MNYYSNKHLVGILRTNYQLTSNIHNEVPNSFAFLSLEIYELIF